MTSATAQPAALPMMADNETLVRNMNSHTALSTADRYNGGPPIQSSRSTGNLTQVGRPLLTLNSASMQ